MIRLLHLADLHLGAAPLYLGDLAQERSKDYLNAFQRAVDYAIEPANSINAVLVVGDFFDVPNPSQEIIRFTTAQLKRLEQVNIPVIVTPGNHDAIGAPESVYRTSSIKGLIKIIESPQVEYYKPFVLNGETVHFYGMAWDVQSKPPFDTFQKQNEYGYHIALIHGTLQGGLFTESHSREVPLELDNLAKSGMDYIALGHIHKYQQKSIGKSLVVYPGTLESRRFTPGEEGDRYLVIATLNKSKAPQIEQLKWNRKTFQMEKLDLDHETAESEEDLANLIKTKYGSHDKFLRLELIGSPSFVISQDSLTTRLSGDFYWLEIQDNTNAFDSILTETWAREETIRGLFVRKLKQKLERVELDEEKQQLELALKLATQVFQKTGQR
jgi:DNA repair protein SbcD/Mre11